MYSSGIAKSNVKPVTYSTKTNYVNARWRYSNSAVTINTAVILIKQSDKKSMTEGSVRLKSLHQFSYIESKSSDRLKVTYYTIMLE